MNPEESEQYLLIQYWHYSCQKGDFETADEIYEQFKRLLNGR